MKKRFLTKRIFPLLFAAALLFSALPLSTAQQAEAVPVSAIVREATDLREEYVKHFLCEDGTYIAATYAAPVHYSENGVWRDIDNRLVSTSRSSSAAGNAAYAPRASAFPVSIPQAFSNGQQLTVSSKGYTFGFGISAEGQNVSLQSTAALVDAEALPSAAAAQREVSQETQGTRTAAESVQAFNAEKMAADNLSSAVVYENVFCDTSLEYIVTPDRLKENLVAAAPQSAYVYRFTVSMDGLVSIPQNDGSILLAAASNPGDVIFTLEAPYMYDAAGETSRAVEMTLADGVLTVTADAAWLNAEERVFPAVIDPTVFVNTNSQSFIKDTYVSSLFANTNYTSKAKLYTGKSAIAELTRTYVKFNLPALPSGAQVLYAQFELSKVLTSANSVLHVRNLASAAAWNPSTLTWNNQPISAAANSAGSLPLADSRNTVSGSDVYRFVITSTLQNWYAGSTNNGLVITTPNESSTGQVDLYSSRAPGVAHRPVLWFGYDGDPLYRFKQDTYSFQNYSSVLCTVAGCTNEGHCFGMSVTSSLYHLRLMDIADIGGNYSAGLYALNASAIVKAPICHYQTTQSNSLLASAAVAGSRYSADITANWASIVNYVKNHAYDNKGNLLLVYWGASAAHSVNFLRYEVVGGQARIYVYDNGCPTEETYFYQDAQGTVRQEPYQSVTPAYTFMLLLDVSAYFSAAESFDTAKVIYADKDTISVAGVSAWPMIGDEEHVLFEIPEQLTEVTITPLVDNAEFKYLGSTYSLGSSRANTVGRFRLATSGSSPSLTLSNP